MSQLTRNFIMLRQESISGNKNSSFGFCFTSEQCEKLIFLLNFDFHPFRQVLPKIYDSQAFESDR